MLFLQIAIRCRLIGWLLDNEYVIIFVYVAVPGKVFLHESTLSYLDWYMCETGSGYCLVP